MSHSFCTAAFFWASDTVLLIDSNQVALNRNPAGGEEFFLLVKYAHEFVALLRLVSRILKVEKLVSTTPSRIWCECSSSLHTGYCCSLRTNWHIMCHFVRAPTKKHEAHFSLQVMPRSYQILKKPVTLYLLYSDLPRRTDLTRSIENATKWLSERLSQAGGAEGNLRSSHSLDIPESHSKRQLQLTS
jgi:hypothetical protein